MGKFFRLDGCQNKRCFGISEDNFFDLNADTATLYKTTTLQPLHSAQRCVLPVSFPVDLLVVNPPERKLAKHTSAQCSEAEQKLPTECAN